MSTPAHLPMHLLPPSLRQIAEFCGDEVMWDIWRHYAGGHLSVPKTVTADHHLAQTLGPANAFKFCQAFGGELMNIPKAEAAKRAVRNAFIKADKAVGLDNFTLCRKYNLTERQISTICQGGQMQIDNYDIFE